MSPHWPTFLALVLCLGPVLPAQNTQHGVLPIPSIRAEPSPVITWGQPVTIVCEGPPEFDTFRLEKEGNRSYTDVKNPQRGTQARFPIPEANEDTAGLYYCHYHKGARWSEHSKLLQLEMTGDPSEDINSGTTEGDDSDSPGLLTEHVYILTGVSMALLLCVGLLLALIFFYCRHRKMHRTPGEEQRPQDRVSPAVDILERTPDLTTVPRLPEKDREMHPPTPTAGGPPDVTYAQLDQRILTQRTAPAVSPRPGEPTAELSTYATLARR